MKKHVKSNWFLYLLFIPFIALSILLPDITIEMNGGVAWAYFYILTCFGLMLAYSGIFGASLSFESKGLVAKIKEWRNKNKRCSQKPE